MDIILLPRQNQPINQAIVWGRARFNNHACVVLAMGDYIIALGFVGEMSEGQVRDNLLAQLRVKDCPLNQAAIDKNLQNPKLCLIGTAFQQRVWQALLQLAPNETTSYKQLAAQLGSHPRPIGGAVGANLISGFIPCHRVVGTNGKLTGYRWGVDIKAQLTRTAGL